MHVLPVHQVSRAVQKHDATDAANTRPDDLVPGGVFLPHAVVAEAEHVEAGRRRRDDGVGGMLLPGHQVIITARREARQLDARSAGRLAHTSVQHRGHAVGVEGAAREHAVLVHCARRRGEGNR